MAFCKDYQPTEIFDNQAEKCPILTEKYGKSQKKQVTLDRERDMITCEKYCTGK